MKGISFVLSNNIYREDVHISQGFIFCDHPWNRQIDREVRYEVGIFSF